MLARAGRAYELWELLTKPLEKTMTIATPEKEQGCEVYYPKSNMTAMALVVDPVP